MRNTEFRDGAVKTSVFVGDVGGLSAEADLVLGRGQRLE